MMNVPFTSRRGTSRTLVNLTRSRCKRDSYSTDRTFQC